MARVEIAMPSSFLYSTKMKIRLTDLNYGGHMGNEHVLVMAQEARQGFFQSLGHSEMHFFGVNTIMGDAAVSYQSEGHFDDEIEISVAVEDIGRKSFDLVFLMENLTTGRPLAIAKTGIVCYSYEEGMAVDIPEEFKDKINA